MVATEAWATSTSILRLHPPHHRDQQRSAPSMLRGAAEVYRRNGRATSSGSPRQRRLDIAGSPSARVPSIAEARRQPRSRLRARMRRVVARADDPKRPPEWPAGRRRAARWSARGRRRQVAGGQPSARARSTTSSLRSSLRSRFRRGGDLLVAARTWARRCLDQPRTSTAPRALEEVATPQRIGMEVRDAQRFVEGAHGRGAVRRRIGRRTA